MERMQRLLAIGLFLAGLVAAGCSPEATRTRSGGAGGDIGNRDRDVEMHGRTNIYWHTPQVGEAIRR